MPRPQVTVLGKFSKDGSTVQFSFGRPQPDGLVSAILQCYGVTGASLTGNNHILRFKLSPHYDTPKKAETRLWYIARELKLEIVGGVRLERPERQKRRR